MRQYVLTDRDFEDFYNLLCKIEDDTRLKHEEAKFSNRPLGELLRTYRYHLIGWRNDMMSGDDHGRKSPVSLKEPKRAFDESELS